MINEQDGRISLQKSIRVAAFAAHKLSVLPAGAGRNNARCAPARAAAMAGLTIHRCGQGLGVWPCGQRDLDQFQSALGISLESLEKTVFPFASACRLEYRWARLSVGLAVHMIVCSCNVLSDHDVRSAVSAAEDMPRNAKQVYGCLGCSAECGRCARTIKTIIDEALGACAQACCSGCPHSHADAEPHVEFALAAS